jgi:hydroxymethylbilane synthase
LRLRIGSRGSQLALWQANHIAGRLREQHHDVDVHIIHTTGDKIVDVALSKGGAKGMFTKEIEEALSDKQIDLAVHSLKDLPTELAEQFEIAAIPAREDPRDALCSADYSGIEELPPHAKVGTSSLRRQAQLRAIRPDLVIHPLRGNVDTRLRKLESGRYEAIILALSGLRRLGKTELVRHVMPIEVMCPAAGQGALAIEIRRDDDKVRSALTFLDDKAARSETDCERAVLKELGGGCQVPIGANAKFSDGILHLQAVVASPDGKMVLRESGTGENATALGALVGGRLLKQGGGAILEQVYAHAGPQPEQP